jgi:hypothetical protein
MPETADSTVASGRKLGEMLPGKYTCTFVLDGGAVQSKEGNIEEVGGRSSILFETSTLGLCSKIWAILEVAPVQAPKLLWVAMHFMLVLLKSS